MKNSSDNIGNRTRDLPACSALPQPTAPPCGSVNYVHNIKLHHNLGGQVYHLLLLVHVWPTRKPAQYTWHFKKVGDPWTIPSTWSHVTED